MSKWPKRTDGCHLKNGRRKRIIESPSHATRVADWHTERGKQTELYRCSECGYVHAGGRPGWNTKKQIERRLKERGAA